MNGGLARCVATETNWRLPLGALAPWARTENSCWQGGLKTQMRTRQPIPCPTGIAAHHRTTARSLEEGHSEADTDAREGQSWADTDAKHRAECEQEVKQQELIVHCGAG